jgi:hypothetical protein
MSLVFNANRTTGNLDFVASWFQIAANLITAFPHIRATFVATNSICQGEQVATLWENILNCGITIQFAYQTFKWSNEAKGKAAVHCVIIGIGTKYSVKENILFLSDGSAKICDNISPYLIDAPSIIVTPTTKSICGYPTMARGNQPTDGGHLIIEVDEYEAFIEKEPNAKTYIKRFMGAREFLHNEKRYCLWLVNCSIKDINAMPHIKERVRLVKETRENSIDSGAKKLAQRPTTFREINNPLTAIVVPLASSENRKYIPIGFIDDSIIVSNLLGIIPNGSIFHFGILISNVHMAWMRTVAGRLKSDYRYSQYIVYNTFIWPDCTVDQKEKIEQTAQNILDVRSKYPNDTLADLYDEVMMPYDLRKAHRDNDRAVWEAYGRAWPIGDEAACVAHLMKLYQEKTKQ